MMACCRRGFCSPAEEDSILVARSAAGVLGCVRGDVHVACVLSVRLWSESSFDVAGSSSVYLARWTLSE